MPTVPEKILDECSIDIKVSPIELDDEDDWPDQNFIDSIQNESERYLSIPKHSERHNQLTPESGIGTDDGLPHFSHNVGKYKEKEGQFIGSSVTDSYDSWDDSLHFSHRNEGAKGLIDGSEYSPETLNDLRFLKEIQNFPNNLKQKYDQSSLKNGEYEYSVETEKTAISCAESVLQTDKTYSDSTDWSSEEDLSCSLDHLLPEDSFLMKLEVPLTESEKSLIDEFYQKMEEVEAENEQERKENIHNPSINCTENALKRIKCLVDEYLKRGIRLNSSYNDSTVTNLIFEKMRYVLDSIVRVTSNTTAYGQFKPYDIPNYDEDYDDEYELFKGSSSEIVSSIIGDLLIKGGKVKRSYFYYDRLAHVTRSIDCGLFEKCEEIESELKDVAYESVINKQKGDFEVAIDNGYFFIKYEKGNVVEMTKVTNNQLIDDLNSEYKLNLKVGILQIGESIVRVEKLEEQRNYTDVPQGKIKMSFTIKGEDKAEKISILLYSDKEDSNKVKVELDLENQKKFDKLKDKSSLGKNCLLGGKSVIDAIKDQEFTKYESYKPAALPTLLEESSIISSAFSILGNKCKQFGKYVLGV